YRRAARRSGAPYAIMTTRLPLIGALAATLLALLSLPTTTAQAPTPTPGMVYNVWVVSDNRVVELKCVEVETVDLGTPTEAPHETPTFAAPPTFTPAVWATATPTPPTVTPTQEHATLAPTPHPTSATTPVSACQGRVLAQPRLNVRAMPTLTGRVIGSLHYGAMVDLHAKAGRAQWYRIWWVSAGEWAYIAAEWIAPDPAACWGLLSE
ncbi:MAG: SH3 domain-containing protein, partial [Planctomycetota bacterium]